MSPEKVKELLGETPWMTLEQGITMTSFIHHYGIKTILELGFEHGVSSCYMAAAIEDKKDGMLVTIDTEDAKKREPNIEQLLELVGLTHKVTIYYEPRTYLWRLMKLLEHDPTPRFDLCYIDGSHQWVTDGFAFLLADRLLKPEGWVIFDDLDWTVAGSPVDKQTAWAIQLTDEERFTPQIRKVYELLVKSHPNYDHFRTEDGWAYAHKRAEDDHHTSSIRQEVVVKTVPVPFEMIKASMAKVRTINKWSS